MTTPSPGRIFISYRRQDTAGHTGWLRDRLAARFGDDQVFMDVATLEPGSDFPEAIRAELAVCDVLVAVIGPGWATATDAQGRRRLDDSHDFVRVEVETALRRGVRVIPVLTEGAVMPGAEQLPKSLAGLVHRHALVVRHETFGADVVRLVAAIEGVPTAAATPATGMDADTGQPGARVGLRSRVGRGRRARGVLGGADDRGRLPVRPAPARVLQHVARVNAVAFSPDSRRLATGTDDGTARLWDVATGQERLKVGHHAAVVGVAFSPNGRWLATVGLNTRLWDTATGRARFASFAMGFDIRFNARDVAFSPNGRWLALAGWDGTARIKSVAIGKQRLKVSHDGDKFVDGVAFSPDGRLLATASWDQTARTWWVATGTEGLKVSHDGFVVGVAFSPNGRWLATASGSTARLWDVATGVQRLKVGHHAAVVGVAFSPDSRLLATASHDQTARTWDVATGKPWLEVSHDGPVVGVALSPDGRLLATASHDHTAGIWSLGDPRP